jgi:two-component system sensor histidine kinase KdpD
MKNKRQPERMGYNRPNTETSPLRSATLQVGRRSIHHVEHRGNWLWSLLAVAACTGIASVMFKRFELVDIVMIYLLGVVIIASRTGTGPSLVTTILSIAAFDFFFVPPYYTFVVNDVRYVVTFVVMFIVSVVISRLTLRIHRHAEESSLREERISALYSMSRNLVSERNTDRLRAIAAKHIGETFNSDILVLLPDGQGRISFPVDTPGSFRKDDQDREAAQWALDHHMSTGANTPTGPDADATYFPLVASRGTVGILGMRPLTKQDWFDEEQIRYLEAFMGQTAIAIERALLVEETHRAMISAETENLRSTLLSSISHDLRTPLTAVTGAASILLENDDTLDRPSRIELIKTIQEESDRLNSIIKNILAMTRLEAGTISVNKEWQSLEEIVGVVLNRLGKRLDGHPVMVHLPDNLPLIPFDGLLLEQVLINLFENAIKYTPEGTTLSLSASERLFTVTVELADHGPGIPPGQEEHIFEKFVRGHNAGGGVGLGLAICRAIVHAHGGKIWVENREGGGAVFRFTLSAAGLPVARNMEEERGIS